jgi:NADPH-dependent 2,4-dienoyl-CoA reductase/sulfur reductase-like enzyme/nitrite reductase/ring-hydroxylating ferredoxin subunit
MADDAQAAGPDFSKGFRFDALQEGQMVRGRVDQEPAILVRRGDELFAVGSQCTHYHGPLNDGLLVDDTVRCPWHHACFSLRTGEALRAPAFDPIPCWRVERVGDTVFAREKQTAPAPASSRPQPGSRRVPASIVIVGGGAAGLAAADMLRREGYDGPLTMLSADDSAPSDRPNLSKDYLAGTATEDWIPLKYPDFYTSARIDLVLDARVSALDVQRKQVVAAGNTYDFDALLLATGADPVRLPISGAQESQTFYLRTFKDSKAIVSRAASARSVAVVGSSFIGLEVAASLRTRGLAVHVVAPEKQPLERVMGPEVGRFIRQLHESKGVIFHLERTVSRLDGGRVTLSDGSTFEADFVVLGVGVRPSIEIAEKAGLRLDRGVVVDEYLETSAPGIFAAGDIARWPDPHTGNRIRVEHWVVAERQGQVAARNMLGYRERYDAVPFFWSQHYDVQINYVGHAEQWDRLRIDGSLDARDCSITYEQGGRTLAVATIFRDIESLQAEHAMESRRTSTAHG